MTPRHLLSLLLVALVTLVPAAWAQQPVRLRATVQALDATSITVKSREGEVVTLALPAELVVTEVYPIDIAEIKPGSYIGAASMPQADGTLEALEVVVFPEAQRGVGEGHRPYDLLPQSTMTNATVEGLGVVAAGRTLKLRYKDGEKTLNIPPQAPIVSFRPGERALLVVGARVIVTGTVRDGRPTALRIQAGRNGFAPPM